MGLRRVVITGLGALSPVGNTVADTWASLVAGRGGVGPLTRFDCTDYSCRIAAELKDFSVEERLDRKLVRRTDPFIQYALIASHDAVADADLVIDDSNRRRIGVVFGSGIGGIKAWDDNYHTLLERGPSRVSPFLIPMLIGNMAAGFVSIEIGAQGPSKSVQTACATSATCAGDAMRLIQWGEADIVIAGGTEASLLPLPFAGFSSMKALSTRNDDPVHASRPFDLHRDGFVMGEGAAALVLEDLDHALARGARIYGELVGYGQTSDAYHMASPAPDGSGAAEAMRLALAEAQVRPEQVGYVNAHATSTGAGDAAEAAALGQVWSNGDLPPVSATKSMTGHMLGAAGAIELMVCTLAVHHGVLPPTINYETPDPACDFDCVPNQSRVAPIDVALSNSFGFGGHNCALVVRRYA